MRTITPEKIERLAQILACKKQIAIVVHQHPDGDALGSASALYHFLLGQFGRDIAVRVLVPDAYPATLDFVLKGVEVLNADTQAEDAAKYLEDCDLIVCLDMSSPRRSAGLEWLIRESEAMKVVVDHHPDLETEVFDLAFSEPECSSTCELLYWVLKELSFRRLPRRCAPRNDGESYNRASLRALSEAEGVAISDCTVGIDPKVGEALMTGMTTDTNNFANSTTASTLQMASELLAVGVDRDAILAQLFNQHRESRYRLMGYLLYELTHITDKGVAYAVISKQTAARFDLADGETEGFVNLALGIAKVRASVLLKEDEGHFRVSIRSKAGFNCTEFARTYFHGGGHERASGGKLFFPEDIATASEAGAYIEMVTARFLES